MVRLGDCAPAAPAHSSAANTPASRAALPVLLVAIPWPLPSLEPPELQVALVLLHGVQHAFCLLRGDALLLALGGFGGLGARAASRASRVRVLGFAVGPSITAIAPRVPVLTLALCGIVTGILSGVPLASVELAG